MTFRNAFWKSAGFSDADAWVRVSFAYTAVSILGQEIFGYSSRKLRLQLGKRPRSFKFAS
jgi:hypothetical protein